MGQTSMAMPRSRQVFISSGCLIIENLDISNVKIGLLPMTNSLRAQQYCIVEVHVGLGAVAQRLASVEDEGYIHALFLAPRLKPQKRRKVVDVGLEFILCMVGNLPSATHRAQRDQSQQ